MRVLNGDAWSKQLPEAATVPLSVAMHWITYDKCVVNQVTAFLSEAKQCDSRCVDRESKVAHTSTVECLNASS